MRISIICLSLLLVFNNVSAQSECNTQAVLPVLSEESRKKLNDNLATALEEYKKDSSNADAIIWYGRRTAYIGHYAGAIIIFSKGIALHPNDARMYRHRGHRFITMRCLNLAIADFEKAAQLVTSKADQVEPDGMPNAKNIPTSTLQSNIWYHLGLAYYLKADYTKAADAYINCLAVSKNPDMYIATANWLYITLRRLKKEKEASELLASISAEVELIENKDYLRLLLLYKGEADAELLKQELIKGGSSLSNASMGYGLGNYYLLKGDKTTAKMIFEKIVSGDQWASFGFIAAEAELKNVK
jgi:tetratricopeptide (TPR) repeat protein